MYHKDRYLITLAARPYVHSRCCYCAFAEDSSSSSQFHDNSNAKIGPGTWGWAMDNLRTVTIMNCELWLNIVWPLEQCGQTMSQFTKGYHNTIMLSWLSNVAWYTVCYHSLYLLLTPTVLMVVCVKSKQSNNSPATYSVKDLSNATVYVEICI